MTRSRLSPMKAALLAATAVAGLSAAVPAASTDQQTSPSVQAGRGTQTRSADPAKPQRASVGQTIAKAIFGGMTQSRSTRYPNGPGWTHAHVQRMARKRRNQQRNRRAHRGSRR